MSPPTRSRRHSLLAPYYSGRFLAEQFHLIELEAHDARRVIADDVGFADDTRGLRANFYFHHPMVVEVELAEDDNARFGVTGRLDRLRQRSTAGHALS